nr:hypothetical protein [Brucella intermedia]
MKAATIGNFLQRYVPTAFIDKNAIGAVQPLVADDLCNSAFHLECPVEARAGNAQVLGDKAWPQHWIGKVLVDIGEDALAYRQVGWKASMTPPSVPLMLAPSSMNIASSADCASTLSSVPLNDWRFWR